MTGCWNNLSFVFEETIFSLHFFLYPNTALRLQALHPPLILIYTLRGRPSLRPAHLS